MSIFVHACKLHTYDWNLYVLGLQHGESDYVDLALQNILFLLHCRTFYSTRLIYLGFEGGWFFSSLKFSKRYFYSHAVQKFHTNLCLYI